MTGALHRVLTTTELENPNLIGTAVRKDRSDNLRPCHQRRSDLKTGIIAHGENLAQDNLRTDVGVNRLDLLIFSDRDAILLSAGLDNCVHVYTSHRPAPGKPG